MMTSRFAKRILDFYAQKAGKDEVSFSHCYFSGVHEYTFYADCFHEHSYVSLRLMLAGKHLNFYGEPLKRPYVWLLKKLLHESSLGNAVWYGEMHDGIFLPPFTTLQKTFVEMDLDASS